MQLKLLMKKSIFGTVKIPIQRFFGRSQALCGWAIVYLHDVGAKLQEPQSIKISANVQNIAMFCLYTEYLTRVKKTLYL